MDIYEEMQKVGVEIGHHESDLHVPVTPITRAIVTAYQHANDVKTFTHSVTGELWYDIPFAYIPFWEAKQKDIL